MTKHELLKFWRLAEVRAKHEASLMWPPQMKDKIKRDTITLTNRYYLQYVTPKDTV